MERKRAKNISPKFVNSNRKCNYDVKRAMMIISTERERENKNIILWFNQ